MILAQAVAIFEPSREPDAKLPAAHELGAGGFESKSDRSDN
jgi:hypothetical protein